MSTTETKKKVLVVATFGPANPECSSGAFVFAREAVKAGAETRLVFVLQSPLLLKKGVAETVFPKAGGRSLRETIDFTLKSGVQFFVCNAAMKLCDVKPEDLIEEVDMIVGPSFVITEGLRADLTLTF